MTREQFEELNEGVYVVETHRYLNNPGIFAVMSNDMGIIAYKNPNENEQEKGATTWAKTCHSVEDAYQSINDYIASLVKEEESKKYFKKNRR